MSEKTEEQHYWLRYPILTANSNAVFWLKNAPASSKNRQKYAVERT